MNHENPYTEQVTADTLTGPSPSLPEMPIAQAKSIFSRLALGIVTCIAVQMVGNAVIYAIVGIAAPQLLLTGWFLWLSLYGPLYLIGFPIFIAIVRNLPQTNGPGALKRVTPGGMTQAYLASVAFFMCFTMGMQLVNTLVEKSGGESITNPIGEVMMGSNPWVNFFFVCVVAPLMEEIIFRQMLYKRLIAFGGKVFILFSALLFALMHPNIYQIFYAFLIGVVLGGVRYFSGKLWPCILLHFIINVSGGGGSLLLLTYFGEEAVNYWVLVLLVFGVAGIVVIARWLLKKGDNWKILPGEYAAPSASTMLLNVGVVLYTAVTVALIVLGIVMN